MTFTDGDREFAAAVIADDLRRGIPIDRKLAEHYRHVAREMVRIANEGDYTEQERLAAGRDYYCVAATIEEMVAARRDAA